MRASYDATLGCSSVVVPRVVSYIRKATNCIGVADRRFVRWDAYITDLLVCASKINTKNSSKKLGLNLTLR